jgi:hypothetical protein
MACCNKRGAAGPFTKAKLTAMIKAGEVNRDTLVWKKGMANWTAKVIYSYGTAAQPSYLSSFFFFT